MDKTLAGIASTLDLGKSWISTRNSKIFLCGGPIDDPNSLRGALKRYLDTHRPDIRPRILLAEDATRNFDTRSHFKDLVALEENIADIAALILLIVESPGSIAELGAFTFVERLRRKVAVVVESRFDRGPSFIHDGPFALLGESRKFVYPWLSDEEKPRLVKSLAEDAAQDILENLILDPGKSFAPEETIQIEKPGAHRMLFIADFINLAGSVLRIEIVSYCGGAGIVFEDSELARYLFLLANVGLIREQSIGDRRFYLRADPPINFLNYSKSDKYRLQRDILNALPYESARKKSLDSALGGRA